jgi:hypothetical protein
MKRTIAALVAAAGLAVTLTACGDTHSSSDVEPGGVDTAPAQVIQFPDGFRNVAKKCDGPNMVYSASRGETSDKVGGSVFVVANDPRCKQ